MINLPSSTKISQRVPQQIFQSISFQFKENPSSCFDNIAELQFTTLQSVTNHPTAKMDSQVALVPDYFYFPILVSLFLEAMYNIMQSSKEKSCFYTNKRCKIQERSKRNLPIPKEQIEDKWKRKAKNVVNTCVERKNKRKAKQTKRP